MFGTATSANATRVLLLGSGELGKEVAIECQRLGLEVIACDRYADAPAMQVAHRSYVLDMLDGQALEEIINKEQPAYVVPEIEAIATDKLVELEEKGLNVVPTAKATKLTMNREGIRRLAAEELELTTSPYRFADNYNDFKAAVEFVGIPCVVKPVMSSSGKGQSVIKSEADIEKAWNYAQEGGRTGAGRVIVEGFIDFDYEITLLTVRAVDGVHFCAPIGHRQEDGDYRESWQPQAMSEEAIKAAEYTAEKVVNALGGYGIFGVELFVKGDKVIFNEVSPRPHDTGMVTLISQEMSEFALHVRAFTGMPINQIVQYGPSASAVILGQGTSTNIRFDNVAEALAQPQTQVRLFGKPEIDGRRRLGVVLTRRNSTEESVQDAVANASKVNIVY
ncbi:formate-dependent phosphoribosylglycinamide formyltransferase [Vibrio natriegens]|jgi:phosphoribosylglycinamide formyltransferase 2|uniref:Formate-dependent phosphoribosylglycinamide formyltransferase n=1 Tax=Vibrio natriegens NBRC 15636 = ATCC 14048 = DSM 759 TaxID=1219067 RepID=A0AAN0Y1U9_VIBNA|nr:formate-dependent phosphoribosylglycinamide formyltransferase [Vibrio natriegens]ALR15764.1 phosphoribosylglycinamide formyltransferase 2 [Vibrio natriegens NBRC 15636 = ATCC 14048 = DSM 759]ANQ12376.1 phosphoribosylglycinamide formyltransferase 2 [Vibrio natriegens NBRC 15636 = ATCC 14048 = DSM 759]EPM42864.1 phosphoribosylglycinamide formyltransferase [Vibrio natriegens NBRC 15636 = ATCC 14048 = DSM 759]MDX6026754.1 formate-dependent phosphoribosylglycinamide formyltransferase [Vibrio natr